MNNIKIIVFLALVSTLYAGMAHGNPEGYRYAAEENQSRTYHNPVDLAYGANGQYYYIDDFVGTIRFDNETFGGDPIEGVTKKGYVKNSTTSSTQNQSVFDYEQVAIENETMTFHQPVDLAYGAQGRYHHIDNFVGTITFDNKTFGGDPIEGVTKAGYMKPHRRNNHDNGLNDNQNINDYQFAANENETRTYHRPVDLAYGAKDKYRFIEDFTGTIRFDNKTFGSDPIEGVPKKGYVKNSSTSSSHNHSIRNYDPVATENETMTFHQTVDLAYGANGQYHFLDNVTGTIRFDNKTFGGDPIEGVRKSGYMKLSDTMPNHSYDINDFKFVADENETKTFRRPVDLAYGADGQYYFLEDFTGTIRFDNESFGGDPNPGNKKKGYVRRVKINRNNDRGKGLKRARDNKQLK